jgi:hypothetical protein
VQRINNYDASRDTTIRVGFRHIIANAGYKFFPRKGIIDQQEIDFQNYLVFNPDNSLNERDHTLKYSISLRNTSGITATLVSSEIDLLYPISFTGKTPLPKANYHFVQGTAGYYSDTRKVISYTVNIGGGSFYNGSLQTISGSVLWRNQPHVNVTMQAEYDKLSFPYPYGNTALLLLSPKVEINFSTKLFWTTFLQYNTQANNYNINSRLQYRYKPMSDLFLVYTDNYFTSPLLKNKNRAIVFKLNYWLNK